MSTVIKKRTLLLKVDLRYEDEEAAQEIHPALLLQDFLNNPLAEGNSIEVIDLDTIEKLLKRSGQ